MITVRKGRNDALLDIPEATGARMVIQDALCRSITYTAYLDGDIAAAWGLIPPTLLAESAYLWLLTTALAEEHKFLLVRYSQIFVREMLMEWGELTGDVVLPNDRAVRWIKWLGGEFSTPIGRRLPFVIRRKDG